MRSDILRVETTIRLPTGLHEAAARLAAADYVSLNTFITRAIQAEVMRPGRHKPLRKRGVPPKSP